jgi:Putative zinc-finger
VTDETDELDSGHPDGNDPDTRLILDYLSAKLDVEAVRGVKARADADGDFRNKLSDLVILEGLVAMALEAKPDESKRECRTMRALFLDYLEGRMPGARTAELDRHLEDCLECAVALERCQAPGARPEPATPRPRRRAWLTRGRAAWAAIAVLTAASAFAVFLRS